ncbi:1,4-alpha-glucan branching protein [Streptomyces bambusae]|uniref:maltokinase N-terminal cap-like domain-containing protein n=1 Tax=Streptomyces bambusae TaxID=1550616 RepID=UPI001CFF63F8|nr:1,4-alpha-glucan branching protein [Streptomyces bambusae]MCB5169966.1 1,4-alpha-glucan branching protein [Streptomyces bambusae]
MAVIHHTELKPTKLELLTTWLPTRPWYRGDTAGPVLAKAGGFRLDDPEGEVGIEFMVVTDASGPHPASYLIPLTYRGAPLDGASHALVGTMEHGVLGHRWAYDGTHDPVLIAQLAALLEGRTEAQQQSISNTPDPEVTASPAGRGLFAAHFTAPAPGSGSPAPTGFTVTDDKDGTEVKAAHGNATLRLLRLLRPGLHAPQEAAGHIEGAWQLPDDTRARGLFAAAHI